MSLYITSLNSGSNGNCYYIGNDEHAVLVDAGISCRETEQRMKRLGLCMSRVRAVFVSHEHTDHIAGIPVLARKYSLPVYVTPATLRKSNFNSCDYTTLTFLPHEAVHIEGMAVTAFPKFHDADDPHSFIIEQNGVTVGVFTDIGVVCDEVIRYFRRCHAVFLEANYDEDLLEKGRYPYFLKKRIRGGKGHLSNAQALELFHTHRSDGLSHLLLSHLSKDNNDPDLVQQLFDARAGNTMITVASRFRETPVFHITGEKITPAPVVQMRPVSPVQQPQLSLF